MAGQPPGDGLPSPPRHAAPTGQASQGDSAGPHSRTPTPTARGWWSPTARPEDGQLGEGERLNSDGPHDGERHPPPGDVLPPLPQRAMGVRKGASCGAGAESTHPHRPHPGHTGRGGPAARPRGRATGGGTARDTRRPSQRWQATSPAARSPHRACKPRGQCWAPTPAHPRSQHVGGGPRQPGRRAGGWGRGSA